MPQVLVTWKSDDAGWQRLINSQKVQAFVETASLVMIEIAKGLFQERSKHESEPPVLYYYSFKIRRTRRIANGLLVKAREVANTDRTAEWVEFGAHAGGTTPVLRYRIFGRTLDVMEANPL